MKKTILASALAFAFVGTASAAPQWVDIPENVTTQELKAKTDYKTDASYSKDYSAISAVKNGAGEIGFAKTDSANAEFTKDARLWIGAGKGFNVIGFLASGKDKTFVNNGSIYAYAEQASD